MCQALPEAPTTHHQLTQCSSGPARVGLAESQAGLVKALAHVKPLAEPRWARGLHSLGLQVEDALGWPREASWDASQAGQGGCHPRGLLGRLSPGPRSLPLSRVRAAQKTPLPAPYSQQHWAHTTLQEPTQVTRLLLSPPPRGQALGEDVPARTQLPAGTRGRFAPVTQPQQGFGKGPLKDQPNLGGYQPRPSQVCLFLTGR